MSTGTSDMSRIRSRTFQPSSSGIDTSRTTRSGRHAWNSRRPSRPFFASLTSAPPRSSSVRTRPRMSSSSSTTSTRESLIPLSYHGHPPFPRASTTFFPVATVLIVDPDPATRSLLELLLLRLGHRPIGPREWVEGEEPDVLLLEPASRPGLRLARGVRRRFSTLPILCVSIDGPSRETRELNPVCHVMKPFRRHQLEAALEQALTPSIAAAS